MYLPKTTYDWVKRVGRATDGFSKEERRDNRDRHCGEMKETKENSKKQEQRDGIERKHEKNENRRRKCEEKKGREVKIAE